MNQFTAVLLALFAFVSCEPPRQTYGVPSSSLGSSQIIGLPSHPQTSEYIPQPIPVTTYEGHLIDQTLLNTVKQVILDSENSGSSVPIKPIYGPPSKWSNRVVDIDFGDPFYSHPIAYYIGKTYAPQWQAGWIQEPSAPWIQKPSKGWTNTQITNINPRSGWTSSSGLAIETKYGAPSY